MRSWLLASIAAFLLACTPKPDDNDNHDHDDTTAPSTSANPAGGSFVDQVVVTLAANDDTDDAPTIHYTTDGATPTTSSSTYAGPLTLTATTTLSFFAVDASGNAETPHHEVYTKTTGDGDTTAPVSYASPGGGDFSGEVTVTLSATDDTDAAPVIRYTTNGATPTASSTLYTSPLAISSSTTLKFFAMDASSNAESVHTEIYNVTLPTAPAAPVVTSPVAGDNVDSPVEVTGTGEAGATVDVFVMRGVDILGGATGTVDNSGAFSLSVAYDNQDPEDIFDVVVTQSNDIGDSPATTVQVKQGTPAHIDEIYSPQEGDDVASQITVTGAATAGANVSIDVLDGATLVTTGSGLVDGGGHFSVTVTIDDGTGLDELEIAIGVSNQFGDDDASINVNYAPVTVSGEVAFTGQTQGTLHVRLFQSSTEVINDVGSFVLDVDGNTTWPVSYSIETVPSDVVVARAFVDRDGNGWPSLSMQAAEVQAPGSDPVDTSGGSVIDVDLTLLAIGPMVSHTSYADLRTMNEGRTYDPANDHNSGTTCGGYTLRATASLYGSSSEINGPFLRTPGRYNYRLLNDGGCEEGGNNSESSFDYNRHDTEYTLGLWDPDNSDIGTYYVWSINTALNLVEVHPDDIAQVVKLDGSSHLTQPSALVPASSLQPTLIWEPVAGAGAYGVHYFVSGMGPGPSTDVVTTTNHLEVSSPLPEHSVVWFSFTAYDVSPENGDIDAMAWGASSRFLVDTTGTSTSLVSGHITNLSGHVGDYAVLARAEGNDLAALQLPASATSYALRVFNDLGPVALAISIDEDGDGYPWNDDVFNEVRGIDVASDVSVDLRLVPPLELLSPAVGATDVGYYPTLSWSAYSATAAPAGDWSYVLFAGPDGGQDEGPPAFAVMLPSSATSYDFDDPPTVTDLVAVLTDGNASSVSSLSMSNGWMWGLAIMECATDDFECIVQGLAGGEPNFYTQSSGEHVFYTELCLPGFAQDGEDCVDVDECDENIDDCGGNTICENDTGSYSCSCLAGYVPEGFGEWHDCVDEDGCAGPNPCIGAGDEAGLCVDVPAPDYGHTCECSPGYTSYGGPCEQEQGCAGNTCNSAGDIGASCNDHEPPLIGYDCSCSTGYVDDGGTCVDLDGCYEAAFDGNPCDDDGDGDALCYDAMAPADGYSCGCSVDYVEVDGVCVYDP